MNANIELRYQFNGRVPNTRDNFLRAELMRQIIKDLEREKIGKLDGVGHAHGQDRAYFHVTDLHRALAIARRVVATVGISCVQIPTAS